MVSWSRKSVRLLSVLAVAASVVLGACATAPEVRTDHDPKTDLSAYRTFGFINPLSTDRHGYSTLTSAHLKNAARRELERRGYRYDENNPEMLVNFNVSIRERQEVRSDPSSPARFGYFGYRSGFYDPWPGYPQDVYTVNYRIGTATVDVVDAQRKQLVWQGILEGRVTDEDLRNPGPAIDQVMMVIFSKFPATSKPG